MNSITMPSCRKRIRRGRRPASTEASGGPVGPTASESCPRLFIAILATRNCVPTRSVSGARNRKGFMARQVSISIFVIALFAAFQLQPQGQTPPPAAAQKTDKPKLDADKLAIEWVDRMNSLSSWYLTFD